MKSSGEVTLEHEGKSYGATFNVKNGMLLVKTHTETRSVEIGERDAEAVAREALREIVSAQKQH